MKAESGGISSFQPGRWLWVAAWMGVIFFFSAQQSLPSMGSDWLEKLRNIAGHFFAYAVLALLVWRAAAADSRFTRGRLALVFVWCAIYALSDEWHQSLVPNRTADMRDWIVDMIGAWAGSAVFARRAASDLHRA